MEMPVRHDLTGLAHGAAGIAWSLLELAQATGEPAFQAGGSEGLRYVRRWFSPEHQNWPDFRNLHQPKADYDDTPTYSVTWCHGAPGIGMALLRAAQITGDPAYGAEAEAAIQTTLAALDRQPTGREDWSLCHGSAGNAELLLLARDVAGRAASSSPERLGALGRERYDETHTPWPCGVPGGGEAPNLMLGTAGIGYSYLRLYDPARVPSVLLSPAPGYRRPS